MINLLLKYNASIYTPNKKNQFPTFYATNDFLTKLGLANANIYAGTQEEYLDADTTRSD